MVDRETNSNSEVGHYPKKPQPALGQDTIDWASNHNINEQASNRDTYPLRRPSNLEKYTNGNLNNVEELNQFENHRSSAAHVSREVGLNGSMVN